MGDVEFERPGLRLDLLEPDLFRRGTRSGWGDPSVLRHRLTEGCFFISGAEVRSPSIVDMLLLIVSIMGLLWLRRSPVGPTNPSPRLIPLLLIGLRLRWSSPSLALRRLTEDPLLLRRTLGRPEQGPELSVCIRRAKF